MKTRRLFPLVALKREYPLCLAAVIGITAGAMLCAEDRAEAVPDFVVPKLEAVPDLTQTDPQGEFARGGKSFCAPVAVSNSLMALFRPTLNREAIDQYDLVNSLATESHMKTDPVAGTGATGVIRGVQRFLDGRGVTDYRLAYQGWRSQRTEFGTGVKQPQLDWIRETIAAGGAVWINLGWYTHDQESDGYTRVGGHWVTVVGYGKDEDGNVDPSMLVIHDPAPRAGRDPAAEFVRMRPIESGKLISKKTGKAMRDAAGLYRMAGGMHIKSIADCAIMDGAVALRLGDGGAPR